MPLHESDMELTRISDKVHESESLINLNVLVLGQNYPPPQTTSVMADGHMQGQLVLRQFGLILQPPSKDPTV